MNAEEVLLTGDLSSALRNLQDQIRGNPAATRPRVFLFQLLCVLGQWERAGNQLDTLEQLDVSLWPLTKSYREIILCEKFRGDVFDGKRAPLVFGEPMEWLALLLEAVKLGTDGHHAEAAALRGRALEAAPATPGSVNGKPFQWLADADSRLGPVLEAIVNGRYYWIPFQRIAAIDIPAPEDLRDLVWIPAQFTWINAGSATGFIPTRYPGSQASADAQIQLSHRTEWLVPADGTFHGLGQRILTTDQDDYALLDVRRIDLTQTAGHSDG